MKRTDWTVGEYGIRPAGDPDKCFYCQEPLGGQHKEDCPIRCRTVVVEMTMNFVFEEPEFNDEEKINFRYNQGTWCASNIIDEIERIEKDNGCLCRFTKFRYVREATTEDEKLFKRYVDFFES